MTLGIIVAVLTGAVLGLLHAWLTVSVRADQIIAGTMMNIAAFGVTGYLNRLIITPSGRGGAGVIAPLQLPDAASRSFRWSARSSRCSSSRGRSR